MFALGSRLAQIRPSNPLTQTAFTATLATEVTLIFARAVGAANFGIYHVAAGDMQVLANALFLNHSLQGAETFIFQAQAPGTGIQMAAGDSLVVTTSVAGNIAFNIYGVTETLAERPRA